MKLPAYINSQLASSFGAVEIPRIPTITSPVVKVHLIIVNYVALGIELMETIANSPRHPQNRGRSLRCVLTDD